jgi:predicted DNA-binding protein (MmcQ/YjbR family)
LLIEMHRAVRAPDFHRNWFRIDWDAIADEELRDRVETSYGLVFFALSKKL